MLLLPGVLGRWRPDLQGKERTDSKQLDRDVFVSTKYGQVQGFKVHLYDNPLPENGYRPFQTPVERKQAEVAVFLGIPYAAPPINEGRFRVCFIINCLVLMKSNYLKYTYVNTTV